MDCPLRRRSRCRRSGGRHRLHGRDRSDSGEAVVENNARSVLVSPMGRRRKAGAPGAPGYDFSFLSARSAGFPGSIRSDRRRSERGGSAHFPRASRRRPRGGAHVGLPGDTRVALRVRRRDPRERRRRLLWPRAARDGGRFRSSARRRADRAGRTLVRAARPDRPPLEEALPVELNDRRGGLARAAADAEGARAERRHADRRRPGPPRDAIGATAEDQQALDGPPAIGRKRRRRRATAGSDDSRHHDGHERCAHPIVAVQRYGRGRTMVFGGEASWRWRMLAPAADRTYEHFWRQAARWLAISAPIPFRSSFRPPPSRAVRRILRSRRATRRSRRSATPR